MKPSIVPVLDVSTPVWGFTVTATASLPVAQKSAGLVIDTLGVSTTCTVTFVPADQHEFTSSYSAT